MILTLEVVGPHAAKLGAGHRKVFGSVGGTLGRLPDNDWVLPDPYVSGRHVRIRYANGQFFLEDTSTNGVFINSPDRRLPKGQSYALTNGDRFFIDVYEILATIAAEEPVGDPFAYAPHASAPARRPSMPIPDDPFGLQGAPDPLADTSESDPLRLLGLEDPPPPPQVPKAADLAGGSPLNQHFRPPDAVPAPVPASPSPVQPGLIPDDFDPLAADYASTSGDAVPSARPNTPVGSSQAQSAEPASRPPASGSASTPRGAPVAPSAASARESAVPAAPRSIAPPAPQRRSASPVSPRAPAPPAAPAVSAAPRAAKQPARDTAPSSAAGLDLKALLAGAGIESGALSPEAAESFGQILRVVVAGLMDLLRARERIKSEFRIQMTTFKSTDNNPLKFSANVDDALHNLLVKRNAAYLGPVEAFGDAFQDVRNHQMAMLAGVRVAFESMLAEFDPERLQEEFDRQLKKGSILSAPAKLRYWELYRERFHDTVKDADASFRALFGDEFAKAYEEQLEKLRALSRSGGKQSDRR